MSFWKTQPVNVSTNPIEQILSAEDLLSKINNELEAPKIKLEYNTYKGDDLLVQSEFRASLLKFINDNYVNSHNLCLIYSDELFSYYLHDSLVVQFYPKGHPEKIIGVIIGKKKQLHIIKQSQKKNSSNIIEVDFLCLTPKLRTMHLAPYMIGVLTKETVIQLGISTAYYTISDNINSAYFGKKQMFHKPINIKELILAKFFTGATIENDKIKYEKFFNNYKRSKEMRLVYINNQEVDDKLVTEIHDILFEYSKKTYEIFDYKSKESISLILKNPFFHNFLFYEEEKLVNFVSIYRLDSHNKINAHYYKNGYIYLLVLKDTNLIYIDKVMDLITAYCYDIKKNEMIETIDMITLTDIFPVKNKNDYETLKFVEGSGSLSYYVFNMNVNPIENKKNGLFTI